MKEFEIKIPVDDLELIEYRLRSLGAIFIGFKEELDYYIDTRPCLDLVSADSALRLRISKDLQLGEVFSELTFKGPREPHDFAKVRMEVSVEVKDPLKILDIFKMLNFKVLAVISKRRRIYQYNVYRVHLDDVKGLGKFVEIEYICSDSKQLIENDLLKIVDALGLPRKFIKKSYLELILSKSLSLEEHGV